MLAYQADPGATVMIASNQAMEALLEVDKAKRGSTSGKGHLLRT